MAKASGHSLNTNDIPIDLGMAARGDRNHDIAAWFGVNQGRIAESKDGKYGSPAVASSHQLPPSGPPGIKGRRLHATVMKVLDTLQDKALSDADVRRSVRSALVAALDSYNKNEG